MRLDQEPDGYGLYTYLLIPEKPVTPEAKKLALGLIEAFLNVTEMTRVERDLRTGGVEPDRKQLNLTQVPVTAVPAAMKAEAVLDVYNHSLAKLMTRNLPLKGDTASAAMLASTLAPLKSGPQVGCLVQDIGQLPAGPLAAAWFSRFLREVMTPRAWSEGSVNTWALSLQASLERVAAEVGAAREGVLKAIGWVKFP